MGNPLLHQTQTKKNNNKLLGAMDLIVFLCAKKKTLLKRVWPDASVGDSGEPVETSMAGLLARP